MSSQKTSESARQVSAVAARRRRSYPEEVVPLNTRDSSSIEFEILGDVPAPWSWDHYESWLWNTWTDLLDNSDPSNEKRFQKFLEQHPCLVPGGEGTGTSFGGHHGSWEDTLISQPPLPGIFKKIPDFMWVTKTSEDIIPVLVEIEAPGKPWLTKKGLSAKLGQPQGQLAEWKRSLDEPANRLQFAELYNFPARWATEFNFEPRFMLIYGRRREFEDQPERNRERRGMRDPRVDAMTYDRLKPLAGSRNAISVRIEGLNRRVLAIPPTFRLGPDSAEAIAELNGLVEAISSNELISEERRAFLLKRLPYWQDLGKRSVSGGGLANNSHGGWE
jgi:hypothetical protein